MNCQVFRNKQTNEIEEVLAPNGQESILFKDLLAEYKDKEVALQKWATTYTPSFKASYNGNYDVNGEMQLEAFFSPKSLSSTETKDLSTKIQELDTPFPGLSHLQVSQAISMLVNHVSTEALEGKVNLEESFNKLAGELTKNLQSYRSIDLTKVPTKAKSIEALIANYEATLENFEELASFATKILSEDDKFKLDIEEVTDDKGEVYDIAVYEIDPKSGITPTMKRVLGGFTKNKVNYLNKPEFVSFEEAFNTIAAIVADKQHNMEEVIKALEQHTEARPWLTQAIKRLKSLDKQLQNQFLSRMVMSKLDMKYVTLVQDGDAIKLNVINTNRNDIGTVIHGNWMQNIKTTSIMRPFEGTYKVRKDTFQDIKAIYDKKEHTIDDFNTIMLTLGVNLSPLTLEKIAQFGVDGKSLEKLFSEREGLVNILMTELSGMISADKTLATVNPLSQGIVSKLAYFEARFNTASYLTPNTFRSEEKQLYGYTMHCMLTDRVKNLLNGKMVSDLQDASFTKHSYYLSLLDQNNTTQTAINFRNRFKVFDSDLKAFEVNMPGNKQKAEGFTSLAEAEHELTKIAYFLDNNSKVKDGIRTAKYILPTMSDKTRVMGMEGLAFDLTGKDLPELVYDRVVYPEIDRILTHSAKDIKSYNDGARLIMFLPELNSVEINDDGVTVFEYLNEMKNIAQTDSGKELLKEKLLPKIQEYIDALVEEKIATFKRLNITDKIPKKKGFVQDYVINNLINITEAYQLFIGDPAMFYKTDIAKRVKDWNIMKYDTLPKEEKVKISEETFINVGKRLAMQIAPGTKLADSEKNHYYQIMLEDRNSKSLVYDYLVAIMGEENASAYGENSKGKGQIEGTDAQEFVTWQEHLYVLEKLGEIEPFTNLEGEEVTQEDIAEARKICESTKTFEQLNDSQVKLLTKLVQVMKPVYTGQVLKDGVMQVVYIKSSAIALIPQLTQGLEIDKLRLSMENFQSKYLTTQNGLQNTVRASFGTANKVGAVLNPVSMWNKDGSIKEMSMEEMEKAAIQLPRDNFRIQQSNPFKSGKKKKQDSVTIGSQERKLLFVNLLKLSNFEFQGKKYKGAELAAKYNQLYDDLFKINLNSLYEELGIDPTSDVPISKQVSVETLGSLLQKEAEERNYPIGDIRGLQIKDGKFVMPLWLHSSSDKYESLLNSIVSNRVIGIKLPGYSYVLGTEEGFKDKKIVEFDKVDESLKSKIVFTDSWEGELKPARFVLKSTGETITKSIDSYNPNEIELKPAQVIAPMKFRDAKGNLLNLLEKDSSGNYIYVKDTARGFRLDTTKFDKETLRLFGFRIPTSGLMSMATIEIVGFTPLNSGDTLIAPRDFTKQMGSDFDVDKIVGYMYNTKLVDGKLIKDNSTEEKKLQNDIIELHHTVLSHKSDYVQTQIHRPLSFDFAAEVATIIDDKRRGESKGMFTPLSTEYQKIKMMSGSSGKAGTGVYSLDVVFHANTQSLNALGTPISLVSKEAGNYSLTIAGVKGHKNFGEEMTVTPSQVDIAIDYLKSIEQPTEVDKKFMELMVISQDSSSITQFKQQYPGVIEEGLSDYRFISDVLAEAQNYSVDNEKEQIMGRINDNSITFNARKPLNMLGIDKSFTKVNTGKESKRMSIVNLFMTQTVLIDRVTPMMNSKNSTLATYDSSPLNSVAVEIMAELSKYKINPALSPDDLIDGWHSELVASMSAQEMYDMIGLEFGAMSPRQLLLQKAILAKYIELDAIGTQINSIQTSINTDSKKLGKSLFENIATLEKVLKLPSKTVVVDAEKYIFTNAEKLIGEFRITPFEGATQITKGVYVKPTTVNGFATIYGLVTAVQMYEEVFPYTSKQFNDVANILGLVLGKEETTTKLRQSLLKTLKSYAYANSTTQNLDKSVDETRAELFIDTDTNMSLAKFIKQAKEVYPKLDRYAVINSLKLEVESNGQPSILKWNNSVQVEFEDQFYLSFLAMLTDTTPIGLYNGKEMTIQSLAQNMITYSYLEGGIQLATQFIRHIPVEYLETFGITNKLNNFNVNSPEAYGIDTTRMKDESYIPDIIRQHVQHNPRQLPQLPQDFNDSEFIIAGEVKSAIKSTPPFVIIFNPKNAVKGIRNSGITIFELTDSGYIPIPTLGVSNFNEFNMDKKGETQKSLVHKAPEKVEVKPKIESKSVKKGIKYTYNLDQGSSREVLKVINNTLGNLFLETEMDFKLEIVKGYEYEAVYSNGVIKLSEGFLKDIEAGVKPYSYFERIMLEEFSHGLVREAIKNPTPKGQDLIKSITRYYNRARVKIAEKFGQERLDALEARFKPGNSPTGITDEERSYIYGGINMIEFTGHLLTNSDFQNMLNEVVFEVDSQPQTFWSKIKELLTNLLLDFINAPNLKENSLTTMAVADILELIGENRQSSIKTGRMFNITPIQAADKKAIAKASIATQYIGFGEGIEGSSTEAYRKQAGKYANTGNYNSDDIIFVSIGGKRGALEVRKAQQDKTIKEAIKAIEAGATLLTDNKAYVDSSDYNEGEKRLAKNLEAKGYKYSEKVVDGQLLGFWRKETFVEVSETQIAKQIYKKLGEKTQSRNVIIKPWGDLKDATKAITSEGVISTRIKNSNEHFGNPFSHDPAGKAQGLIKTETVQEAVEAYTQWILQDEDMSSPFYKKYLSNMNGDDYDFLLQRRDWIREQLESKKLVNKPILYYKELGEPSHATALDYLINSESWNTSVEKPITKESKVGTSVSGGLEIGQLNSKTKVTQINVDTLGEVTVSLIEGNSSDWKDNHLEFKTTPNPDKFQLVGMGMRILERKDLEERFGKDVIDKILAFRARVNSLQVSSTKEGKPNVVTNLKSRVYKLPNGKTIIFNDQQWEGLQKIESFLGDKSKQTFTLSGYAGCLALGTKVLMYDGTFKEVQDVVVGDRLMGIDSTPRNVLELKRGVEQMYWIRQNKGIDYRVNESHILSLRERKTARFSRYTENGIRKIDKTKQLRPLEYVTTNIEVRDYLKLDNSKVKNLKGYKSSTIQYPEQECLIDPYYLGLWLGDGHTESIFNITNADEVLINYLKNLGVRSNNGLTYTIEDRTLKDKFKKLYNLTNAHHLGNKYIPSSYLINSVENRLKLLAGIIDSDGSYSKIDKYYEVTFKSKQLADDLVYLTRSLGFYTSITYKEAKCTNCKEGFYPVYRVLFVPELEIPVLLDRKRYEGKSNFKNRLHTGITVEKDIVDNYYGFVLDGDHLFMLEDFTVTHNTGKSTLIKKILDNYRGSVVVSAPTHAAVEVITETSEKTGVTLQSLLGLKPGFELDNYSAANPQFARSGGGTMKNYKLVVIDESSMINSELFDLIMSDAEKAGTKIIFMGDNEQFPPVGEEDSRVFSETDELHQLTHVERTKDSNPLMLIFDAIRSNTKSKFDNFKHETNLNKEGEGVEFTDRGTTFQERIFSWFRSPEFEKNTNYAKVIAWTNQEVETWNNIIRGELIDSEEVVAVGDFLMSYRTIQEGKEALLKNSKGYKVTKVVPRSKTYKHQNEVVTLKGFDTTFKSGDTVFIVDHQDKETNDIYKKIMYDNTVYSKTFKNWNTYYDFANVFLSLQKYTIKGETIPRTFDYGYAVTGHKSQGSSYNKVGILEDNIDKNPKNRERNRGKYVAFSRAKENVISLSSKEGQAIQREKIYDERIEDEDIDMSQYDDSQNRPIEDLFASPKDFKVDEFKSTLSEADRKLFNRLKREGVIKTKCK